MDPQPVAVVGASGYTGMELLRRLLRHPGADLRAVTSRQEAGRPLSEVFPRFRRIGRADELVFSRPDPDLIVASGARFAFLALPHGVAAQYALLLLERGLRVIDLSADFRLRDAGVYQEFYDQPHPVPALLAEAVYGLPEWRADEIAGARLVASPGCYPTSVLLPLLPLLRAGLVDPASIHVSSMSGVSGAGRAAKLPLLFCECAESLRPYGLPKHRHLSEIEQELTLAAGRKVLISFVPHLVPVRRGILTTTVVRPADGTPPDAVGDALREAFAGQPFVRLLEPGDLPDTKHVTDTNFIDIGWSHDPRTGRLVLCSAEDNLGKGAGTQALQSFNLMAGLPQDCGLLEA